MVGAAAVRAAVGGAAGRAPPCERGAVRAKYGPALQARAQHHTLAPLTGEDLAATITQWPRVKKGGTDAWEAGHFKDLPLPLLLLYKFPLQHGQIMQWKKLPLQNLLRLG